MNIFSSSFRSNSCYGKGGVFFLDNLLLDTIISDSTFENSQALSKFNGMGGFLYAKSGESLTISNSIVNISISGLEAMIMHSSAFFSKIELLDNTF